MRRKKPHHYLNSLFAAAFLVCVCLTSSGAHARAQQSPDAASPDAARGIEARGQGEPGKAVQASKKEPERDEAEASHALGLLAKRQGKRKDALKSFEKALSIRMARLLPNIPAESLQAFSDLKPEEQAERLARVVADYRAAAETAAEYVSLNPEASGFWQAQLESLRYYAAHIASTSQSERVHAPADATTRAKFLHRIYPVYTERARRKQRSGKVVLRATLAADGTVQHILVLRQLPDGLTENAIAAARAGSFTPAIKDGHPISVWTTIEYNFNIY